MEAGLLANAGYSGKLISHLIEKKNNIYIYLSCFFKYNFCLFSQLFLAVLCLHYCVGFLQLQQVGATLQWPCSGFSLWWLLHLQSRDSRMCGLQQLRQMGSVAAAPGLQRTDSVVVAHGLSGSTTCRIFPDEGLNPCFSCIGRRILYHNATREALVEILS